MLGTSYFFIDNESGYGEGIDRFVMPRGMFAPRISVIGCADISDLRKDFSIAVSPHATAIYSIRIFSTKFVPIQKIRTCANICFAGSGTPLQNIDRNMSKGLQKRRWNENLFHGRTSS